MIFGIEASVWPMPQGVYLTATATDHHTTFNVSVAVTIRCHLHITLAVRPAFSNSTVARARNMSTRMFLWPRRYARSRYSTTTSQSCTSTNCTTWHIHIGSCKISGPQAIKRSQIFQKTLQTHCGKL